MADTLKILGQVAPAANTLTTLYTVPTAKSCSVSSITVCNSSSSSCSFRISVAAAAQADDQKQYLYWDQTLEAYSTFIATIGITLATTDVIRVRSTNSTTSFNAFGVEV